MKRNEILISFSHFLCNVSFCNEQVRTFSICEEQLNILFVYIIYLSCIVHLEDETSIIVIDVNMSIEGDNCYLYSSVTPRSIRKFIFSFCIDINEIVRQNLNINFVIFDRIFT